MILGDSRFYQQPMEYEQYNFSYNGRQTQSFGGVQDGSCGYGMTQYQDYEQEQQRQEEIFTNYQNSDQMNYAPTYETYGQQPAISQDYTNEPQHYDQQQPVALSAYGSTNVLSNESHGYGENYAVASSSEFYPGEIFYFLKVGLHDCS